MSLFYFFFYDLRESSSFSTEVKTIEWTFATLTYYTSKTIRKEIQSSSYVLNWRHP